MFHKSLRPGLELRQLEERDGQIVRVDIQPPPEAPKIDVRALLPAVVFEPVQGGRPGGT